MLAEPEKQETSSATRPAGSFGYELRSFADAIPHKASFAVVVIAWVALFHFLGNPTLGYINTKSMFGWLRNTYGHSTDDSLGMFIPGVVIALLWSKRDELAAVRKEISWSPLVLFALGLLLHIIGYTVQQTRLSVAGFFFGLYAITGLLWGWQWLRATFFPFFLFAFMMPLTGEMEGLTLPLRHLATKVTVLLSRGLLGICVDQQGTLMKDCAGHFQYNVEAACSGLRSLTTMLTLGCIFAFTSFRSNWKRALLIFSAVPLAVFGNVIRLLSIVVAANWKYDQMIHARAPVPVAEHAAQAFGAMVHDHNVLKLAPYLPAFIGMMLLARWLPQDLPEEKKKKENVAGYHGMATAITALALIAGTAAFLLTQHSRQKIGEPGVRVVAEPIYAIDGGASTNPPVLVNDKSVYLPPRVLDYRSQQIMLSPLMVSALPKDTLYGNRFYLQSNGFGISCQVVLMGADRSSIHKPQYCLKGLAYDIVESEPTSVRVSRPHDYDLPVMKLNLRRSIQRGGEVRSEAAVFVYWFVADGELTSSHVDRMWWIARDMLRTGVLQRWAYVICLAPCEPGYERQTFEKLKEFIAASAPQFQLTSGPALTNIPARLHTGIALKP